MLTQLFTELCTMVLLKKIDKNQLWFRAINYLAIALLLAGVVLTVLYS